MNGDMYELIYFIQKCANNMLDGNITNDKSYMEYWFKELKQSIREFEEIKK